MLKVGLELAELGPVGIRFRLCAGLGRGVAITQRWVRSRFHGPGKRPLDLSVFRLSCNAHREAAALRSTRKVCWGNGRRAWLHPGIEGEENG
jgi:hypothetical protein